MNVKRLAAVYYFCFALSSSFLLFGQTAFGTQSPPEPQAGPVLQESWQGLLWQYPTGGKLMGDPAAARDGTVYCLSEDRHLYALEAAGKYKWKHYLKNLPLGALSLGIDGSIYTGLSNGELAAINPCGRQIWRFDLGAPLAAGVSLSPEGFLYAGNRDGRLFCLDNRGRRRWRVDLEAALSDRLTVVPGWGLLCPMENQRLTALDLHGQVRWTALMAGKPGQALPLGDKIYVPTHGQTLAALSWEGGIIWSRSLTGAAVSGPFLHQDSLWLLTVSGDDQSRGRLYTLDPETGQDRAGPWDVLPGELFLGRQELFFLDKNGRLEILDIAGPSAVLGNFDGRSAGVLLFDGGQFIQNGQDWRIKAYGLGTDYTFASGWNQRGGGQARQGLSSPPPPGLLPAPGNDELILREMAARPESSSKLYVLEQIREGYNQQTYRGYEGWVLDLLEKLAGCGLVDPQYLQGRVTNDFPQVRRQAAQLLAEMGAIRSQSPLEAALLLEWDSSVRRVQALALGRLGSDYSGSVTRALYSTFMQISSLNERRMLADSYLEALAGLSAYYGAIPDPAGFDFLREIYRGDYGRETKNRALSLLSR